MQSINRTSAVARQPPAARQRAVHDVLVVGDVRGCVWDTETVLKALHQVLHRLCVWIIGYERQGGRVREEGSQRSKVRVAATSRAFRDL